MPNTDSLTLVLRFGYRGLPEEFSNTYHLEGTTPTTTAEWKTLADAIWASQKACHRSDVVLVRTYGYVAGNDNSVAQWDYTLTGGTGPAGTLGEDGQTVRMAGDQAATLRAAVGLSSKGKRVYVRKYFHGGTMQAANPDLIPNNMKAAMNAHGAKMLDGTLPGAMKWCGPQGADPTSPSASVYVTTRTLKRRGKRPTGG